jgi:hypothetical protein
MKRGRDEFEHPQSKEELDEHANREEEHLKSQSSKGIGAKSEIRKCPYLDTVNRSILDFDSEKLCSQTLTNRNVYCCLVCGKYFEGRGKTTPAYTHSLEWSHYVFMNLESARSYCLPDSYEIRDTALNDIVRCLNPSFSLSDISNLDNNRNLSRDIHAVSYLPGFIGLNNLNATDDVNVILHLLSHVSPLRDFFLQPHLYRFVNNKFLSECGLVSLSCCCLKFSFLPASPPPLVFLFLRLFVSYGRLIILKVLFHLKNSSR